MSRMTVIAPQRRTSWTDIIADMQMALCAQMIWHLSLFPLHLLRQSL
jgi:hypothetical protein